LHTVQRCSWAGTDSLYIAYHDNEWGVPVHDDRRLFEMLILEGFQAGLSWITILKKRENFREAFAQWNWNKVSKFTDTDVQLLMSNSGIIRNKLKISSAITNAQAFIKVRKEFGSFDAYIWQFTKGETVCRAVLPKHLKAIPTCTPLSDSISKDLLKRGFKFVGSVIIYSFLQAVGIVDDHMEGCFKRA
jgi:DNA-3-methyladenine glycosylase I